MINIQESTKEKVKIGSLKKGDTCILEINRGKFHLVITNDIEDIVNRNTNKNMPKPPEKEFTTVFDLNNSSVYLVHDAQLVIPAEFELTVKEGGNVDGV